MRLFSRKKTYTQNELDSALANNSDEIMTLAVNSGISRDRMSAILSGTYDNADTLHNIYTDFGYPTDLVFSHYWNMYRRLGIAKNVVELIVDQCWIEPPKIMGSSQFDSELSMLIDTHNLWQRMKGLDTRQRVGRYAGLFMRVRDGKKPSEPLEGSLGGMGALVQILPLYESQLEVSAYQENVNEDDYDMPTMYEFKGGVEGDRGNTQSTFNIHPSRLIIASEGADNGSIYGISALEAPYNSLMDLRKIMGAGGEGFYKNAAQSIVFELLDTSSAGANKALLEKFNANFDDFTKNRTRRAIWTPGLKPHTLESNLITPKEFLTNSMYDVAAASKIPISMLLESKGGLNAGDEDTKIFLKSAQSRRENFISEMLSNTLDWLIKYGILPSSTYGIEWGDLMATNDQDKIAIIKDMAEVNQSQFLSGGTVPFSGNEMRERFGLELEGMPEISEIIEDEE